MKLVTGKVVAGRIEVEGERLKEGSTVTVLAREDDERFELTADRRPSSAGASRASRAGNSWMAMSCSASSRASEAATPSGIRASRPRATRGANMVA